jgi:hypothetical protein
MSADPLRDDLGVELEQLVAIEPPPELAARVRARVAGERVGTWWPLGWQLVGAAAVITVLATTLMIPEREAAPLPVVPPSNAPAISIPLLPLDVALRLDVNPRRIDNPTTRSTSGTQRARASHYPLLVTPPLEPLNEISIEPVAIEPLPVLQPLSGDRQ